LSDDVGNLNISGRINQFFTVAVTQENLKLSNKELKQVVEEAVKEDTVLLLVRYENSTRFIVLTLPKK